MRRRIVTTLVLACVAAGCGGGDDDAADEDAGAEDAPAATAAAEADDGSADAPAVTVAAADAPADDEAADDGSGGGAAANANAAGASRGEHGGVSFTITGDHEASGDWVFVPEASSFDAGWWSMSFTDPSNATGSILALSLDPDNQNVSFSDGQVTITGMPPQCTFDVQAQDSGGASGSFTCEHLTGILLSGGDASDIGFSATFDATTGSGGGGAEPATEPAAASATEQPAAGEVGGAAVTVSGGHDASASWAFSPAYSMFNGTWTMTFEDPSNPMTAGGPFLTLLVVPEAPSLTFSDGLITIVDSNGKCDLQLDHQDEGGAAGTMSCSGVEALGAAGPVDITATFDGTV